LAVRLASLDRYISLREQHLLRVGSDLIGVVIGLVFGELAGPFGEAADPIERFETAVSDLLAGVPPQWLFETDLEEARGTVGATYREAGHPSAGQIERNFQEAGVMPVGGAFDYDYLLSQVATHILQDLHALRSRDWKKQPHLRRALLAILARMMQLFDTTALAPARQLRASWQARPDDQTRATARAAERPKRRGRPADPAVAARNRRIVEAWQTGLFHTYAALAEYFTR
jgi:hypothetical protein